MRTIGRRYTGKPRNTWVDTCDICGAPWRREKMRLDKDGYLRCPNDDTGLSVAELTEIAALNAMQVDTIRGKTRER